MQDLVGVPGLSACEGSLPRTVAVTGAFGFIGRHLTMALLRAGVSVVAVDMRAVPESLGLHPAPASGLTVARADITRSRLDSIFATVEAVVHLAGIAGVRESWGPRFRAYLGANVFGTQRMLEACLRTNVRRFIFASSSSVYGRSASLPIDEDHTLRPVSPYGVTKMAAEALCATYAQLHSRRLQIVALRYFTVYGPFQRPDMLVARLIESSRTGCPVVINGDGSARRDFTYVGDVVQATLLALSSSSLRRPDDTINVGSGTSVTIRELIPLVQELCGGDIRVRHAGSRRDEAPQTEADIGKAARLLGYAPKTSLATGLSHQVRAVT